MKEGAEEGLMDFGMYALLSLRLEKGYGIWSREFSPDYTPSMCGLDFFVDYDREGFIGRDAALIDRNAPPARKLTLMQMDTDDVDASGYEPIYNGDKYIGFTTSGGYGHLEKSSFAMGYVDRDALSESAEAVILGERRNVMFLDSPPYDPRGSRMRS